MLDIARSEHRGLLDRVRAVLEHGAALAADQSKLQIERIVFTRQDGVETLFLEEIRPRVDPLAIEAFGILGKPRIDPRTLGLPVTSKLI
jgi:hypothetical protein